jgi:TRAP-type C4-dicarboxylate transport system permease small subunit
MMSRIVGYLDKFIKTISIILFVVLLLTIFLAVFDRFILHIGIFWTEELARILFVWLGFLMSSLMIYRAGHFKVTYLIDTFLGKLPKKSINIINEVVLLLLMVFLMYYSTILAYKVESQITPGLRISMSYLYASVPISSAFAFIFQLHRIAAVIKNGDEENETLKNGPNINRCN